MTLTIYNSKTKRKEKFVAQEDKKVKIYVCGPTVYDVPHIGHGRSYVFFDVVRRYLEFLGYNVTFLTNFTDIEDSIVKRAHELGKEPMRLAEEMIEAFLNEMDKLGVKRANLYPRVTEHIKDIIKMAQRLIELGYAYVVDGEVFFDVQKAGGYGLLIDRPVEEIVAREVEGKPITPPLGRHGPYDFTLWRRTRSGDPSWDSPWGKGRPGWHIECSAMATKYLGPSIDIQGGGLDLIFPHHESSSLICQVLYDRPFAKYYLHNGFITVGDQKMSKSLGNFVTLREVLKKYDDQVVRFFLLGKQYRAPLEYSDEEMTKAELDLRRIQSAIKITVKTAAPKPSRRVGSKEKHSLKECPDAEKNLVDKLGDARNRFIEAMNDDFNTEEAIRILLRVSEYIEEFTQTCKRFRSAEAGQQAKAICKQFNDVMGVCRKL
nr:cysteine--tRNA ligase [Candidatus Njordarchaeum guaymaensis]